MASNVWVGSRDESRDRAAADALGAKFVQLDVNDDDSVAAAAAIIKADGGLDALINNAGITGPRREAHNITGEDATAVFSTNVVSIVR